VVEIDHVETTSTRQAQESQQTCETSRNICTILIKRISHNGLYLFTRIKAGFKAYNLRLGLFHLHILAALHL
jgi:hypothetical protein